YAAVILGDRRAARSDIGDCGGDSWVATADVENRLLPFLHPLRRHILGRLADAHDDARVLLREEALGDDDEERQGSGHSREHDGKRDPAISESNDETEIVDVHEP